jgi:hypothetical protein
MTQEETEHPLVSLASLTIETFFLRYFTPLAIFFMPFFTIRSVFSCLQRDQLLTSSVHSSSPPVSPLIYVGGITLSAYHYAMLLSRMPS